MTESSSVIVRLGRIAEIVLNRPDKHNAMTADMGLAVERAVQSVNEDATTRVVLVRGSGRAFCAGGDFSFIDAASRRSPEDNRVAMLRFYASYLSIHALRVPSIAVLHGATVGAGLCFALACDVRLAAREAKLGANFVRVGLHPGMGCTALLPHVVGPSRATELLLSGRLLTGDEAERIGLVSRAVEREALDALAAETAEAIASAAPIAVQQTKATLSDALRRELGGALEREARAQAIDFTTADLAEAVAAFGAGRAPEFRGR